MNPTSGSRQGKVLDAWHTGYGDFKLNHHGMLGIQWDLWIEEVGWAEPATMRTTGVSSINCRAVLRVFWRQHVLCVYTYIYNPPASFPYRIGTPRCCINRFFLYRSPLNFSCPVCLVLAGSNFISKLRVLLLYFFRCLNLVT